MSQFPDDDPRRYHVVRKLDELMPGALTTHKAGVSFDIRVYFRDDKAGYQWAEVAFLDRASAHKIIDEGLPLVGPDVVSWYFGEIECRGFELANQR